MRLLFLIFLLTGCIKEEKTLELDMKKECISDIIEYESLISDPNNKVRGSYNRLCSVNLRYRFCGCAYTKKTQEKLPLNCKEILQTIDANITKYENTYKNWKKMSKNIPESDGVFRKKMIDTEEWLKNIVEAIKSNKKTYTELCKEEGYL